MALLPLFLTEFNPHIPTTNQLLSHHTLPRSDLQLITLHCGHDVITPPPHFQPQIADIDGYFRKTTKCPCVLQIQNILYIT